MSAPRAAAAGAGAGAGAGSRVRTGGGADSGRGRKRPRDPRGGRRRAHASSTVAREAPRIVDAVAFAEARAPELAALRRALERGGQALCTPVPRHLRRRTGSHRRYDKLGRRHRDTADAAAGSGTASAVTAAKPRYRRHRRRTSESRHTRDSTAGVRLVTHQWHAKRMAMGTMWGRVVPLSVNDKGVRASLKAATHACVLHDRSYESPLLVSGPQAPVAAVLARLTDPGQDPMNQPMYTSGAREGRAMVYASFPFEAIGPVKFLWQQQPRSPQSDATSDVVARVWLWAHPACLAQVVVALTDAAWSTASDRSSDDGSESRAAAVSITPLPLSYARFSLVGPQSTAVLQRALCVTDADATCADGVLAWRSLRGLSSPGCVGAGTVVALSLSDPRLQSSSMCAPATADDGVPGAELPSPAPPGHPVLSDWPQRAATCPQLWRGDGRWRLHTDAEVARARQALKRQAVDLSSPNIGGVPTPEGDASPSFPALLIQTPGLSSGFGSGWDLVVPADCGRVTWLSLTLAGGHAVGIAELDAVDTEAGRCRFPQDYPDTAACFTHDGALAAEARCVAEAKPKGKRPNYVRLRTASPYKPAWEALWAPPAGASNDGAGEAEEAGGSGDDDPDGDGAAGADAPALDTDDVDVELASTGSADAPGADTGVGVGDVDMGGGGGSVSETGGDDADHDTRPSHNVCVVRGAAYLDALVPKWPRDASAPVPAAATPTLATLVMCTVQPWRRGDFERATMLCMPTEEDIRAWRKAGRDWGGFQEARGTAEDCEPSREVIGFVTSAVRSALRRHSFAVGFCRASAVQSLITSGREWCPVKPKHVAGRRVVHLLARRATSDQYLPAIVTIVG